MLIHSDCLYIINISLTLRIIFLVTKKYFIPDSPIFSFCNSMKKRLVSTFHECGGIAYNISMVSFDSSLIQDAENATTNARSSRKNNENQ